MYTIFTTLFLNGFINFLNVFVVEFFKSYSDKLFTVIRFTDLKLFGRRILHQRG